MRTDKHHCFGKGLAGANDLDNFFMPVRRNAEQLHLPGTQKEKTFSRLAVMKQHFAVLQLHAVDAATQARELGIIGVGKQIRLAQFIQVLDGKIRVVHAGP